MDISLPIGDTKLNVRVAVLLKTPNGYLFEDGKDKGYIFTIGGRVKINETIAEAVAREVKEEIDFDITGSKFVGMIENFYSTPTGPVHEYSFLCTVDDVFTAPVPSNFVEVNADNIGSFTIRPTAIVPLLAKTDDTFFHAVVGK